VLDHIFEYLDAEMTERDFAKIRQHLDECAPCLRQFDLETALKALVRRSCRDAAPVELRLKVLTRLTEIRVQMEG
jgi:mycothiol system anti-sigma-R factor